MHSWCSRKAASTSAEASTAGRGLVSEDAEGAKVSSLRHLFLGPAASAGAGSLSSIFGAANAASSAPAGGAAASTFSLSAQLGLGDGPAAA